LPTETVVAKGGGGEQVQGWQDVENGESGRVSAPNHRPARGIDKVLYIGERGSITTLESLREREGKDMGERAAVLKSWENGTAGWPLYLRGKSWSARGTANKERSRRMTEERLVTKGKKPKSGQRRGGTTINSTRGKAT